MPRPISRSQLDKLGRRLARDEPISDEDYRLLHLAASMYQAELDTVEERLRRLGFQATTRVKTTGTLVDKLRRTNLSLASIQDFAGARIVIDGTRQEQDQAVNRIMDAFQDSPKAAQRIDRRERPSYGYRAVHVIDSPTRAQVVEVLAGMAETISELEQAQLSLAATYDPQIAVNQAKRDELEARLASLVERQHDALGTFLNVVRALGGTQ
jgi:DNA-binding ferritin-like protein